MAKRKSVGQQIEKAATNIVDAVSVAATGFQAGVLEMAAEEELTGKPAPVLRRKKVPSKKAPTKKIPSKKAKRPIKMKQVAKRR